MTTLLPKDADGEPIPALAFRDGGAHSLVASGVSSRTATAFSPDTRVVSLYATGPVHVRFGDETVSATGNDHFFPSGIYYDVSIQSTKSGRHPHLAVIRSGGADSTVFISEKM